MRFMGLEQEIGKKMEMLIFLPWDFYNIMARETVVVINNLHEIGLKLQEKSVNFAKSNNNVSQLTILDINAEN